MRRKASRRQLIGISLFPFLAVLICTMGVIIVMLVIVVRQASSRAREEVARAVNEAAAQTAGQTAAFEEEDRRLREAVEDLDWERGVLDQKRTEKAEELAKMRQRLAHLDDHTQRLKEQARQLLKQAEDIDLGKKLSDDELDAARKELASVKDQIAKSQAELDGLRKKTANAQKWYALIPYDGPNGTRRRPIYIECTEAGITLQPEGVTLIADDFQGPLGPGNPLDAALRAKREYLERHGEPGQPYPLLVVRPDGIVAYAVARSALKSWDEEFGYELIDAEKRLAYGTPDPNLYKMLDTTVRQARQRQVQRALAMPRKYQPEDAIGSFRTSDLTDSAPEMKMAGGGVGGGAGRGSVGFAAAGTGPYSGTGMNAGAGPKPNTGSGPGGTSGTGGPGSKPPNGIGRGGTGTGGGAGGGLGSGTDLSFATPGTGIGSTANGSSTGTPGIRPGATGTAGKPGTESLTAAGGAGGADANSAARGGPNTPGGVAGGTNSMGGTFGSSGSTTTADAMNEGQPSGSQQAASGQPGGSSSSSSSGQSGGGMSMSASAKAANRRSHNWGLPNAAGKAVAVTRPIRVACLQDRIVVLPDKGDTAASPQNVRVQGEEMDVKELDAFVSAVQKQMSGWGLAVTNGYWKPVLSVDVYPNAERRFQELETALKHSGFEVQRKVR